MVRFGVGLIALIFVLISVERSLLSVTTFKQEESWIGTGLRPLDIANFYQNFNCKSTQRTYLACINSLSAMANYLDQNLSWSSSAGLHLRSKKVYAGESEKARLAAWEGLFKANQHLSMDFESVWVQLSAKIKPHRFSEYIVGLGINHYLSIHRDPHSYLLPKEYYEKVVANSQPRVNSYGFNIGKNSTDVVFARVYPGSLFDKLGVVKGDILLEVDGKSLARLELEEVSEMLRQKDQHQFKVKASGKIQVWKVDKKNQILPSVSMKKIERSSGKTLHLLSIFKVSDGVCRIVQGQLQKAIKEKTNGIILDLRDNSGGSMDEILCISGLFVGDKKIYDLVYFNKRFRKETFFSEQEAVYFGPLVVLINRSTASSAEILAGVIQHYGRGTLVGERTFGKGSFQEGEEWPKNKKLLYFQTKGTFHLPSGRSPQLMGILPDVEINESLSSASLREEELYFYPIGNREAREKVSKRVASVGECRSSKKEALTADRLLGKALGHIDCIQL